MRVEPVCIIFTFSIKQSRHILEEGVKALALAMVVHLMLKSTFWPFSSHTYPARVVFTLWALCLKLVLWLPYLVFHSGLERP